MIKLAETFIILMLIAMFLLLAGCADSTGVPPSKLVRPSSMLMIAPAQLPEIAPGDDVVVHALKVRRLYGRETSKLLRLQRYVRVITK